jgi:hypothetical protein
MKKTKSKPHQKSPVFAGLMLAGLGLAGLGLAGGASAALAESASVRPASGPALQQRGVPVLRTVSGHVQNKAGAALNGAVVYLKDTKTLAVKSFIADDGGNFHFGQLSQTTDYEVYAESGGKRSNVKKISSFDNHNSFDFTLTVPTDK